MDTIADSYREEGRKEKERELKKGLYPELPI